jgi:hypothetical protein
MGSPVHYNEAKAERNGSLFNAIERRMNEVTGRRADMYVSDVMALDRDACFALLSFAEMQAPPTTADVIDFVSREFGGKIRPVLETAALYPEHAAIKLMLARYAPTRPLDDTAEMVTVVAGARYLDVDMRDTWDVQAGPDGKKFLRRVSDDDVAEVVRARQARMGAPSTAGVLTVATALGAGVSTAETGDIVRCFFQGNMYPDCTVQKALAGNKLSVQIPHVGVVTVAREAVEIQAISKQKAGQLKGKLSEYYQKAFPDKQYAKELTKDLADEGQDAMPPSFYAVPSK